MSMLHFLIMLTLTRQIGHATRQIALSYFLWSVGEGLWLYIRPLYLEELGATPAEAGFVLAMFGAGRLLLIIPLVFFIDHYNPRQIMLPGWGFGLISVVLMAVAPTWEFAILGLLTYGFSAVALIPTNLYIALAHQHDPTRDPNVELHSLFTYAYAAASAGLIISPAVGGLIADEIGMRPLFVFSILWFVLSTVLVFYLPDFPMPVRPKEGRNFRRLLRQPHFLMLNFLFFVVFVAGPLGYTLAPQFLEQVHHYSTTTIGSFGVMTSLGATAWSLWLGKIAARRGFLLGAAIMIVTFGLFLASGQVIVVALAYFLYGVWYALRPVAVSLIAQSVRPDQQGIVFVFIDLIYGLGGLVGPLAAGAIYSEQKETPFTSALVLSLVVLVVGVWLLNSRNHPVISAYNEIDRASDPNLVR